MAGKDELAKLQVDLLGRFSLRLGRKEVFAVRSPKLQSLFAYLVLHRDSPQPRRKLAYLFYPDSSESQARTNLRKLLHELRATLPEVESFIDLSQPVIRWVDTDHLRVDVDQFTAAARQVESEAQCEQAVRLYVGDLLPNCYEEWAILQREQLHQTYIEVLENYSARLETKRQYHQAITYVQLLLQAEPLREDAYRRLMRLYALTGNRAEVVRTYQECVAVLHRELEVEPSPLMRDLYERLLRVEEMSRQYLFDPQQRELVGRFVEWEQLTRAWERAMLEGPQWVILRSESEIEKSRLVEEYMRWVTHQGYEIGFVRCDPSHQATDFEALHSLVQSLPQSVSGKMSKPERDNLPRQPLLQSLLRAIRQMQPAALLMENVEWCDARSLAGLHDLPAALPKAKLVVLVTLAPRRLPAGHPLAEWLPGWRFENRVTEVDLDELEGSGPKTQPVPAIAPQADPPQDDEMGLPEPDSPAMAGEVAISRLSVAGPGKEPWQPGDRAEEHRRIAEKLEQNLADEANSDVVCEMIANQYEQAGMYDRAAHFFRKAGDQAWQARAYQTAADHYQRALRLLPDKEHPAMLLRLGWAWKQSGSWTQAEAIFRQAWRLVEKDSTRTEWKPLCVALSEVLRLEGYYKEARVWLGRMRRETAGSLGPEDGCRLAELNAALRLNNLEENAAGAMYGELANMAAHLALPFWNAKAEGGLGQIALDQSDPGQAESHFNRQVEIGDQTREGELVIEGMCGLAEVKLQKGDAAQAESLAERAQKLASEARDLDHQVRLLEVISAARWQRQDLRGAVTDLYEAYDIAGRLGSLELADRVAADLGQMACQVGHFQQAETLLLPVLSSAIERGDRRMQVDTLIQLGRLYVGRGDKQPGLELLQRAMRCLDGSGWVREMQACLNAIKTGENIAKTKTGQPIQAGLDFDFTLDGRPAKGLPDLDQLLENCTSPVVLMQPAS